jgi:hypothetical protein
MTRGLPRGSPEKQEIDDNESHYNATGAPDQHVTDIVLGHALSRFGCGFDDLFVLPFWHRTLAFLSEMDAAPLGLAPTSSQQGCSKTCWHQLRPAVGRVIGAFFDLTGTISCLLIGSSFEAASSPHRRRR